jgi:hypothetical protein
VCTGVRGGDRDPALDLPPREPSPISASDSVGHFWYLIFRLRLRGRIGALDSSQFEMGGMAWNRQPRLKLRNTR